MIRTALISWVVFSVPCSVLLGRLCRVSSAPVARWGSQPPAHATLLARAAR